MHGTAVVIAVGSVGSAGEYATTLVPDQKATNKGNEKETHLRRNSTSNIRIPVHHAHSAHVGKYDSKVLRLGKIVSRRRPEKEYIYVEID